jgi:hypothetical protein
MLRAPFLAFAAALLAATNGRAAAAPAAPQAMRVVVVRADLPGCGDACPRWISAEGVITQATPEAFRQVFRDIGDEPLPILIRSPGGVVAAALEIGRLLRARHAAVAVAGTRFVGCRPDDDSCLPATPGAYTGLPATDAVCASACAFLIAGGEIRAVPRPARVGVHRMAVARSYTIERYRVDYRQENGRRVEIGRALVEQRQVTETRRLAAPLRAIETEVGRYLEEMGISQLPLTLGNRVPPTTLRWLSDRELSTSGLANRVSVDGAVALWRDSRRGADHVSTGTGVGRPVSSMATKVNFASVTFCFLRVRKRLAQASTWICIEVRPTFSTSV